MNEKVIFGKKDGDLYETCLLTNAQNYDLEKVIPIIEADGWVIRVVEIDLTTPPDFVSTVNGLRPTARKEMRE